MANEVLGVFDAELTANALFDDENAPDGLFDRDMVKAPSSAATLDEEFDEDVWRPQAAMRDQAVVTMW